MTHHLIEPLAEGQPPKVRLRSTEDLLALLPYLLGYHPKDAVALTVFDNSTLQLTACIPLDLVADSELLAARIRPVTRQYHDAQFMLAVYSPDREHAAHAYWQVAELLSGADILDAVQVDGQRYRSFYCDCADCRDSGHAWQRNDSVAAATAVLSGLQAFDDRDQLATLADGPSGDALAAAIELHDDVARAWAGAPLDVRQDRAADLIELELGEQGSLDEHDLAELALLVGQVMVRDQAWLMMTRSNAVEHASLWGRVVRHCPDRWAVPALCLYAVASWLEGQGAMMVICITRAVRVDPDYSMLQLLCDINAQAVPPSMWDLLTPE